MKPANFIAIREAVVGREADVLDALGIQWSGRSGHIAPPGRTFVSYETWN